MWFYLVGNRLCIPCVPHGPALQRAHAESSYIILSMQIMSNCCLKSAGTISWYEKEIPHLTLFSLSCVLKWRQIKAMIAPVKIKETKENKCIDSMLGCWFSGCKSASSNKIPLFYYFRKNDYRDTHTHTISQRYSAACGCSGCSL